ncbi:MAG: YcjX family protein [Geminicoccaceae bacterium]|nr:YcjX family protein [Geminicoccaceae bacterium]
MVSLQIPGLGGLTGLLSPSEWQKSLDDLTTLALDRRLRLAVTGLRQSGKTVFITSAVHHLLTGRQLPFLRAVAEKRLLGSQLAPRTPGDLPGFPFAETRAALAGTSPHWPEPTHALASLRSTLRFTTKGMLRQRLAERAALTLDVIDYPGEWLLDLPMLEQDFATWSGAMLDLAERPPRDRLAAEWRAFTNDLDADAAASLEVAHQAAELYRAYLLRCQREEGLSLLQPGRFTMPGELAGDDLLDFCPLPSGPSPRGSLRALMAERYERYRSHVVRRFYADHFRHFDRQIVLVDVLSLLNRGRAAFDDAKAALGAVLESFRYGRSGLIGRLFRPRIETLLFAATKADHVAYNQHPNLSLLLEHMVADAAGRARFEGIQPAFVALAALKSTDTVQTEHHGQVLSCVRGRLKGEDRETILFPGEIPPDLPDESDWDSGRFRFRDFAPRRLELRPGERPQHIRLDQALEVLIGDHLL